MKLPLNWLLDFVNVKISPEKLAEKLTLAGLEVEHIEKVGGDTLFDIEVTPNRADCLSVRGLAREVAALTNSKIRKSMLRGSTSIGGRTSIKLKIEDSKLCPRMYAALLGGVKVGPTPAFMKERLAACSVKSINNVVDITNYVMLELGQPLHAFDFDKIESANPKSEIRNPKTIYVRRAKRGEKITTLDGKERVLDSSVLVLADSKGPIDIAGIQGGAKTGINSSTKRIVLTASQFNPASLRATSRNLHFSTESSYRFERGLDPRVAKEAFLYALELLERYAKGKVEAVDQAETKKFKPTVLKISPEKIRAVLGVSEQLIPNAKIRQILVNLGFKIKDQRSKIKNQKWNVVVPSWRRDITIPEDLPEEVGRMFDYNRLPATAPAAELSYPPQNELFLLKEKLRDLLKAAGFNEVKTYSFYGERELEGFQGKGQDHLSLQNPINFDQVYLRRNLLPRLLSAVRLNLQNADQVKVFEIGTVFLPERDGGLKEELRLTAVFASSKDPLPTIQGLFYSLTSSLHLPKNKISFSPKDSFTSIEIFGERAGEVGDLSPEFLQPRKIAYHVAFVTLYPEKIFSLVSSDIRFQQISPYPTVVRDISFIVSQSVQYREIEGMIERSSPLLAETELFDTYGDPKRFGKGKWSMALRLTFQHPARTLTAKEVEDVLGGIREQLVKKFGVTLR